MNPHPDESRLELDLDNRKLIIAFAVLMCVCAGFFVFGFVEGKRQAVKSDLKTDGVSLPAQEAKTAPPPAPQPSPADPNAKTLPDKPVAEQLDWYRKVNQRGTPTTRELSALEPKKSPATAAGNASLKQREAGSKITYSVQIGAFRKRQEAENKASSLKSKGYDAFIDPPRAGTDLYLLKVGGFESRAEASAIQLKLKKDGFPSFIRTN